MRKYLLFIVTVCTSFLIAQNKTVPAFITDSLDSYCKRTIADWEIPGMAVAVVHDTDVVFMKAYGVKEAGKSDPVDTNTLFMIGSNTKAFTATALAMLQNEGILSLNDHVKKWLTWFRLSDTLADREVNILDLLSHRIGFETFQGDFTYWNSSLSRDEVIAKMANIHPVYGFRSRFGYCNAAYLTAGQIIPRVTGSSWENFVKEKILAPLGMQRTLTLCKNFVAAANIASPHTIVDDRIVPIRCVDIDNLAPAGAMSSTVSDMTKWLITLLHEGKFQGKQALPRVAISTIRKPNCLLRFNPADSAPTHFGLYCLGLIVNDYDGKLVYSHSGAVDGFLSQIVFIPEKQIGIVVLTNSDQNLLYKALAEEIRDACLGLPRQDYSASALEQFCDEMNTYRTGLKREYDIIARNNKPDFPLSAYSGTYTNEMYGTISVHLVKNNLQITFSHHPSLTGELSYLKDNTFLCTYSNPEFGVVEIPFRLKGEKINGLTLTVNKDVEFTPYEFIKVP